MEVKLTIIVLAVMTLVVNMVDADFFFNHPLPKAEDIVGSTRYKCVPGRTTIKVTAKPVLMEVPEESDSEEYRLREGPARRTHMTVPTQDESCRVCVCSAEGKDEYCSNRPAESINECLLLQDITKEFEMGIPYDHTRNLYNRIRRDYIWHSDEIPYSPKAKCFRGHSFYTNSITANDTDIDIGSDVESLLDYSNNMTCYFCICHTNGEHIACINRDVTVCEYYRYIRSGHNQDKSFMAYTYDDRPMYFRQLTYRLRRTMDNGIYDMLEAVNHGGVQEKECVPFLSEYSDCNDDNLCSGCHECSCTAEGKWGCQQIKKCHDNDNSPVDERQEYNAIFDSALSTLDREMKMKKRPPVKVSNNPYVPAPTTYKPEDDLLAPFREQKLDDFIQSIKRRLKRSIAQNNSKHIKASVGKPSHKATNSSHNNTVQYHDVIDDLNEDTLKNSNLTGTIVAKKMDVNLPLSGSRRSDSADNSSKALQIEYNQPKAYNQITDNKIETTEPENQFDASHESLKTVFGNFTQNTRNSDLSKIVVNELKTGSEVIGDAGALPVSNITFTSENDTLNAMAFIAGNLLNKLWNMEKEAGASSIETDALKHDKISDLLDLFKEPLNLRQEMFLKNALEQLSRAIDKDKDAKNISICDTIQGSEKLLHNTSSTNDEEASKKPCRKKSAEEGTDNNPKKRTEEMDITQGKAKIDTKGMNKNKATFKAIAKINNVLDLIKKFENIQGNLSALKHGPKLVFNHSILYDKKHEIETELSKDEKNSLNMFGSLLEKITNLILPKRNRKKIGNAIKGQNFLKDNDNLKNKFKKIYNIDITNMTVSAKDKLILDYLTHVDKNPGCLLNKKNDDVETMPSVEGNVLLNLLEFMKLNSFGALIKLLEPQKTLEYPKETQKEIVETTTKIIREKFLSSTIKSVDSYKFNSTKEKLKVHLKTIMEDLVELQSAKGVSFKGNIRIEDALPCIYNLLKVDSKEIVKKVENIDPFEKIANAFQEIKDEVKAAQSRRNAGDIMSKRPKSAVVWERLVKHLNNQSHLNTRRSSNIKKPKSYEQIKDSMEGIDIGNSGYKNYALKYIVPVSERLVLFKALEQDVKAITNVIDDIRVSLESLSKLPDAAEKMIEFDEFNSNMITRLRLNEKVTEKYKREYRKVFVNDSDMSNKMQNDKLKKKPILRTSEPAVEDIDKMKISRTQIVNQLIKNRMEMFLKQKKASGSDVKQDLTYSIAQRILYYLDVGNYKLANELFNWIILQKQNEPPSDKYVVSSTPKHYIEKPLRRMAEKQKKAPVLLEDPNKMKIKHMNWVTQDHLIKQLLNIKNMGI